MQIFQPLRSPARPQLERRLSSCDLPTAVDAICSVLPLDMFVDSPASHMSPSEGVALPVLGAEVHAAFKIDCGQALPWCQHHTMRALRLLREVRACRHLESALHCIPMRTSLQTQRPAQASFLTGTSALRLTALGCFAGTCFAVIQVLERRPYGCVMLTKGVVGPDGKDLKPEPEGAPAKKKAKK